MFLVYINDINENIRSPVQLFADDCVIYKLITTLQDAKHLQEDLQILSEWTKLWQMKITVDKCAVLRCTRSLSPIQHNYFLSGHKIAIKDRHIYVGVEIDSSLKW